jgi:hypothetical protein
MPMEYLVVRCAQKRKVLVETIHLGETVGDADVASPIELDSGTYVVTLEPPDGCVPPLHRVKLINTTLIKPCEVKFEIF